MPGSATGGGPSPLSTTMFVFLGLFAIAIVLAFRFFLAKNPQSASAIESLLNQAYAENRSVVLRIPGAKAGPLKGRYDHTVSRFSRPALVQAEAMLVGNFQKHSDSARWWELQGRSQLLDNYLYSGEQSLIRARELDPHSIAILLDLAATYFQVGKAGAIEKYSDALDILGIALKEDPANPIILFDRAIVEEQLYCFGDAAEDWERYFKLKDGSEWRQEAVQHSNHVHQQLQQHRAFVQGGLLFPWQLASAGTERIVPTIEPEVEDYVDLAVRKWLPASNPKAPDSGPTLIALHRLAGELKTEHHDPWLTDLLKLNPHRVAKAVQLLAQSSQANVNGDTAGAAQLAIAARRSFAVLHSDAGEIRSTLEELWARRLAVKSNSCLALVATMKSLLKNHPYHLLQSQMYLEESNCLMRKGDQHKAAHALDEAAKATSAGRFAAQALNVINYSASMDRIQGNQYGAWLKSLHALEEFWRGTFPDKRAFSFYSKLADSAEEQQHWNAFFALQEEAVRSIDATDLVLFQALAHSRLAEAARRAGHNDMATVEIKRSEELFARIPPTQFLPAYRTEVEINRAKLDAALGNYSSALVRLEKLRSSAESTESYLIQFNFHMTVASIRETQKETAVATQDYLKAARLAATVVRSVAGEREKLQWSLGIEQAYRGLTRCLLAEGKSIEAFEVWEEYRSSRFSSNITQRSEEQVASLSHIVPADQIFVSYFLKNDGLIIWTLTAKGITSDFVYLNERDIVGMAAKLYLLCSDYNSDLRELREYSSRLYHWMIKPIEGLLSGKRSIVFEVDDQLSSLPFEVLADNEDKYLIYRFLIAYAPGIAGNSGPRIKARFDGPQTKLLIVANPTIPASEGLALAPLTETEAEGHKISDLFPNSTLLTEDLATPKQVETLLPQASIFHFAAHSIFESGHLKLLLAPGNESESSIWDLSHVAADKLRSCRLIVLSSCSTQGRAGAELHNPLNPVTSLLAAGVSNVVASRWMIDSSVTSMFMEQFYIKLKGGNLPESALQAAVIATAARKPHPYYWAAFSVFGGISNLAKENGNAH